MELPDGLTGRQLQDKVHEVFNFVRSSVEAELHGGASVRQAQPAPQSYTPPQQQQQQSAPQAEQPRGSGAASAKQVNYLLSLARRAGCTVQQILQRCRIPNIEAIPSRVCSQLIEEFRAAA